MADISLAIMTFSGYERDCVSLPSAGRVERILGSIFNSGIRQDVPIYVFDDGSKNKEGQEAVRSVCRDFNVPYRLSPVWLGVSGNYNRACKELKTEWIGLISDDQIVSNGFFKPMEYFLDNNKDKKIGMAGWSVIFSDELLRYGYINCKNDFYCDYTWRDRISKNFIFVLAESSKWGCSCKPYLRGHCSGSAFVVKRSLWEKKGGFFERIYQPDEDYGDWIWTNTDYLCVQVPTPPVFHYGGASSFGDHCKDDVYANCADNWILRPHGVGEDFRHRGQKASNVMIGVGAIEFKYQRID